MNMSKSGKSTCFCHVLITFFWYCRDSKFCLPAGLPALKAAADNPEGSFTSAAAEAAHSRAAETGPALAAPAVA